MANIEPLTKTDMLDFFNKFIHPHSTTRAKAAVHLVAQASAADLANKTSDGEKVEKLVDTLVQMLGQLGLEDANAAAELKKRLQKVDVAKADLDGIVGAVGGYMKEGAGVAAEQVEQILAQGKAVIAQVLPTLGIVAPSAAAASDTEVNGEEAAGVNGTQKEEKKSKTVVIEDVKAFKASMPLSPGPRAVKDLREFEELGAKL